VRKPGEDMPEHPADIMYEVHYVRYIRTGRSVDCLPKAVSSPAAPARVSGDSRHSRQKGNMDSTPYKVRQVHYVCLVMAG